MLSGLYLNQDMPNDKKLSNGYYLTNRNFYCCDFYFKNIFSDEEFTYRMVCNDGHNRNMEYFECWDGTVLASTDSE